MKNFCLLRCLGFPLLMAAGLTAHATDSTPATDPQNAHWLANVQTTYIGQSKPSFNSPYQGPNSLGGNREHSYTFSATAFLGWRPVKGTELYVDPEVVQGVAFSNLTGLAGVPNGEIQKVAGPNPHLYRARAFLRQTVALGGAAQAVDAGQNQFATTVTARRLVFTVGNFATNDIFDGNGYSHDPRSQFLNWTLMDYGAWDFAADARGFSRGAGAELYWDDWAARYGRLLMPAESNGLLLNSHLFDSYGDNLELEHDHLIGGQAGKIRLLAYRNVATMARYSDALAWGVANNTTPDLSQVRRLQAKTGYGISVEQGITDNVGVFGRFSSDDGEGEEFAWTEADRSISGGLSIKNGRFGRPDDTFGVGAIRNELSGPHRDFLAAGGIGFFLGDGQLHYHPEDIAEIYYSARVARHFWVTPDVQHIDSPGYNHDRGPVVVYSLRLHAEL